MAKKTMERVGWKELMGSIREVYLGSIILLNKDLYYYEHVYLLAEWSNGQPYYTAVLKPSFFAEVIERTKRFKARNDLLGIKPGGIFKPPRNL